MTPLQLLHAVEAAGVIVSRGGSYGDGRPWVEMSSTTWLEVGKSGKFELYWTSREGGPVNELDNLIELPRLLPRRLRANNHKDIKRKSKRSDLAQPVERVPVKHHVVGSTPTVGAKKTKQMSGLIQNVLNAITAIKNDNSTLLDKKGIAQIVKAAVELRDKGKMARG